MSDETMSDESELIVESDSEPAPDDEEKAVAVISVDDLGRELAETAIYADAVQNTAAAMRRMHTELAKTLYDAQRAQARAKTVLKTAQKEAEEIRARAPEDFQRLQPHAELLQRIYKRANAGQPPTAADVYAVEKWLAAMGDYLV